MIADRTVVRAVRAGVHTTRTPAGRTLCPQCWTSHFRRGRRETTCPPEQRRTLTDAELAQIISEARTQRTEDDITAYARKKAAA